MSKNKFGGNLSGKGYYIALILCAAAIGITGYLYYRNTDKEAAQLQQPTVSVEATTPGEQDLQVVATQPQNSGQQDVQPTQGQVSPEKPSRVERPLAGQTVAPYAMDALQYNQTTRDWRVHDGMDIVAETGTGVSAAADGTVYTVYEDETMGMTVVIRHEGGYTTKYASLAEEVPVSPGDTVTAGQTIGYVGATALLETAIGDHVHFSVSCDGVLVDPSEFLG